MVHELSTSIERRLPSCPEPDCAPPHPALVPQSFALSEKGPVRESNEDQFLVARLTKAVRIEQSSLPQSMTKWGHDEGHIFLVADGMGGAAAGEKASAIAVESIEEFLANKLKWFFQLKGPEHEQVLFEFQEALREADARVFEESAEHPEWDGMGTTLTLAYSLRSQLFVAHAGDSRCYLLRDTRLEQLTQDHTLAEVLAGRDIIPHDEKARHRFSHVVTNAIGGHKPGVRTEIHKHNLQAGDVVLLTTDGLTRHVTDEQIAAILESEHSPQAACEQLVSKALDAGGFDNVTVIVARYENA
jgi:PPM family protein phosphatase